MIPRKVAEAYADRENDMTQEFSLDKKKTTILVTVFLLLCMLIFIAGYLSGIIVGLPEPEQQLVVKTPRVKPQPDPPVVTMKVPPVIAEPEPEVVVEVAEPEPEEVAEVAEPEPEEVDIPEEKLYSVQVGSFTTQMRAETRSQQLIKKGHEPYIYHGANSKGVLWYTVRIADFADVDEAIQVARDFRTREGPAVALTYYDSLMLVKTPAGKRIAIEPFKGTASAEEPVEDTGSEMDEPDSADEVPAETISGDDDETAVAEVNSYAVQVGAFLKKENAERFAEKLRERGYSAAYVFHYTDSSSNAWSAVRAGDFKDFDTAREAAAEFEEKESISAIVTRIDAISMVMGK